MKKAIWTEAFPEQVRKVPRRESQQTIYRRTVRTWLNRPGNLVCVGCLVMNYDPHPQRATQCHHWKGRDGPLLLDQRWWLPVCAACHDWIDRNRVRARRLNLLCPVGLWNNHDDHGLKRLAWSVAGIELLK